jgi:archaemetzincin
VKSIRLVGVGLGAEPPPARALEVLARALPGVFHVPCQRATGLLDAGAAFDHGRGQYYSTDILRRLAPLAKDGERVLGVTELDLFVPVLTFVFGEAQLDGHSALVSFHRLREEFYGLPANGSLLAERLVKEAVHELGHTFGLRHCLDWRCVMSSSHGVELLDVKGEEFCGPCARVVAGGWRARAGSPF